MQAGQLNQRIRIESKQVAIDPDYGTQVITWAAFATVSAEVREVLPGKAESQANGLRILNRPARVRVRYQAGITSDMRIVLLDRSDRVLQIVSGPAELGRKQWMEMLCEEYSTAGTA